MPIAFGAALGEVHTATGGASKTLTTTAAVPAGGLIIMQVYWAGAQNATPPSGGSLTWAVDKQQNGVSDTTERVAICSAAAPAGLASSTVLTANLAGVVGVIGVSAFYITGAATTTPVDATGGVGSSTNGTSATANVTTTNADDLIVQAMWVDFLATDITPASGFTEVYDLNHSDGFRIETGYRVVSATGTYAIGGTWTNPEPYVLAGVAYKAAAAAGGRVASRRPARLIYRGSR